MSLLPKLNYEIDINEPLRTTEFTAVQGSDFEIVVRVKRCGTIQTLEGVTPSLIVANAAEDWVRTFAGTAGGANDESIIIPVAGTSLDNNGTMNYDIKLTNTDGTTPIWRRGTFIIYPSVPTGVTPTVGNPIDWSLYGTYVDTAASGPYTAGTGIAFGTADANGKVPIELAGTATQIFYDNTTSELTATDVQAAIDELDVAIDQLEGTITLTVRNETGVQIDKGSVVYISGATGNRATVALADADIANTATKTIGLAFDNIAHNSNGEIVVLGEITGVDTSGFTAGDQVWLSQTPGQPTNIRPADDAAYAYRVGYVETAANNGKILVAPQFEGTVYGETFFAATSASGVRTDLDVPSNSEAILASGDDQTITGATNVQLNMVTGSNGAALLYLGDTNSTTTGLVSRLRLYGADGRFWNWFVQGSAGAPDGHLFQLRYNNENDIASSAIFWFDPADGITTMRMHNRGLVVHRASDDAMTFDVDEDGNVNANALTLTTDLAVTEGGTGASDASGARTNLGLGTIATQDADSVAITGGTITASSGRIASVEVNAQTGTTYTLVLGDAGKVVTMSNAAANTLTIPTNASVAYDVGTVINVEQLGAGSTTITASSGVTLNGVDAGSIEIGFQYGAVALRKDGTDAWVAQAAPQQSGQSATYTLLDTRTATMTGDETLTTTSAVYQFLDPDGSDRNLDLPNATMFVVKNTGDGGEVITVRDASDVTIDEVDNGVTLTFRWDGSAWQVMG